LCSRLQQREPAVSQPALKAASARNDSWENEGGSVAPVDPAETLGIARLVTETYSICGYHYTSLTDAVAQAGRMSKLDQLVGRSPTDAR
jgi:hypothetical protein